MEWIHLQSFKIQNSEQQLCIHLLYRILHCKNRENTHFLKQKSITLGLFLGCNHTILLLKYFM